MTRQPINEPLMDDVPAKPAVQLGPGELHFPLIAEGKVEITPEQVIEFRALPDFIRMEPTRSGNLILIFTHRPTGQLVNKLRFQIESIVNRKRLDE